MTNFIICSSFNQLQTHLYGMQSEFSPSQGREIEHRCRVHDSHHRQDYSRRLRRRRFKAEEPTLHARTQLVGVLFCVHIIHINSVVVAVVVAMWKQVLLEGIDFGIGERD